MTLAVAEALNPNKPTNHVCAGGGGGVGWGGGGGSGGDISHLMWNLADLAE